MSSDDEFIDVADDAKPNSSNHHDAEESVKIVRRRVRRVKFHAVPPDTFGEPEFVSE
jgi:hypothetical protein